MVEQRLHVVRMQITACLVPGGKGARSVGNGFISWSDRSPIMTILLSRLRFLPSRLSTGRVQGLQSSAPGCSSIGACGAGSPLHTRSSGDVGQIQERSCMGR